MKLIGLYLLRALGVSLLFGVFGLVMTRFSYTPRFSDDRMAAALICTAVLLILQLVTFPIIVWKKTGKTRLTPQMIHDEQLHLLTSSHRLLLRHRALVLIVIIAGLVSLVLVDSFSK